MTTTHITTLRTALETAYINGATASSLAYRPQFVSNNHKEGKKVLSSVEDELLACDQFQISVAFITMSGITPLLQTLKELEKKNIPGEILTTNYLNFSEPRALKKLNELQNITLKMYDVEAAKEGFHTKGYIFKKEEIYRIIIGSSNITSAALTYNREWNTKIVSTEDGEMAREIVQEFDSLWNSKYALEFDTFYESYREKYSDEPMTEYEIYSYEAYRRKYQDDIREVPRVTLMSLDQEELNRYVELLKRGKQRLATLDNESIYELMSIKRGEKVTLSATLLFSPYPQAYFPQLCITAIVIPGRTIGSLGDMGERFSDNQRIEGTIPEMLDEALVFVKRNMRTKTIISPTTGRRTDRTDYPITAVREAIINALVHRDYSIHTEGMPIQLIMFEDRIEIHNPGGLYGRITIDQLGKIQPDTRNPVLASALETLGITENRYSGIPTIRMEMEKYNLRQPEFLDERGSFIVKLYKESKNDYEDMSNDEETNNLIVFCKTPRTRKEICDYLGLNSVTYAIQTYVNPLVEAGVIKLSIPDKPKSPKQLYYSGEREK